MEDVCDVHLLFLAKDTISELKWKTTGINAQLDETPTVPLIVKPLGLHNMELPEVQLPELPDKTGPSTSGAPTNPDTTKTNTGDYVTSLGMIIPLPEKDLEIAPELLQHDLPDIFEIEPNTTNGKNMQIKTVPSSINLMRLAHQDIAKWQVQKTPVTLPDATPNTQDKVNIAVPVNVEVPKYNLCTRDPDTVSSKPQSVQPQREASKSVTYAEPTDESSHDSQIIGTIYPVDNRPIPDAKLKKIVGLSEPSAYRLEAQSYIDAKKRGELPPPPKCTLPGYRAKPGSEPDNKISEETTNSEATEAYDLPELLDETQTKPIPDQVKPLRGKLQITKLTLRKPRNQAHPRRMFKCICCGLLCKTIAELNEHFTDKHRKLKCQDCEKTFTKPQSYQKHLYLHKKANHSCDVCGKGFSF